jgi:hypothetical protein
MNQNDDPRNNQPPESDPKPNKKMDANPPFGPAHEDAVRQFRRLLAELIAKQIVNERSKRTPPTNEDQTRGF